MIRDPKAARALPPLPPLWPDTWYVVARSADIGRGGVVDGLIAERPYVIFRAADGTLAALDAHCPHMGTHLRKGQVVGAGLRCPMHHWVIDREGSVSGQGRCLGQRSRAWPVAERFGLVLLFAGEGPAPELPHPDAGGYAWITGEPVELATDWRAMMINGFDLQHLAAVHQRALTDTPRFLRTGQGALSLEYGTRVTPGGGLSSWMIKHVSRDRIRVRQTCHGPLIVVESDLGRVKSCAVVGLTQHGSRVRIHTAFGTIRRGLLWRPRLWLTRWAYLAFLRKDYAIMEGMRLALDNSDDPGVSNVSAYLRSLLDLDAGRTDD